MAVWSGYLLSCNRCSGHRSKQWEQKLDVSARVCSSLSCSFPTNPFFKNPHDDRQGFRRQRSVVAQDDSNVSQLTVVDSEI